MGDPHCDGNQVGGTGGTGQGLSDPSPRGPTVSRRPQMFVTPTLTFSPSWALRSFPLTSQPFLLSSR